MPSWNWACGSPEVASRVSSAMLWDDSEGEPETAAAAMRIKLRLQDVREAKRRMGIRANPLQATIGRYRSESQRVASRVNVSSPGPGKWNRCCCGCAKYYIAIRRIGQENFRRLIRVKPRPEKSRNRRFDTPRGRRASIHL